MAVMALPGLAAPPVTLRLVAETLVQPVNLVNAGDGSGRLFVVEKTGAIKIIDNGSPLPIPFLDLNGLGEVATAGEQGLLGLAFHPQYAANGAFYIYYTHDTDGALTVARYLRDPANANRALPASGAVVLSIPHPVNNNHNAGHIAFGFDGFLYIGTGDGGDGGDPLRNGQNLGVRLGKMLRIAVDGGTGYTIPPGNPFANDTCATGACPEIWAYGLRNPWKFSFDRDTGDMFISDVGEDTIEEIDFQPAGSGGINYGWGVFEGNNCLNDDYFGMPNACANLATHRPPIISYDHSAAGGFSVAGGNRYRGGRIPALQGYYLYADFYTRRVWAARPDMTGTWQSEILIPQGNALSYISGFGEDEDGELYVIDFGNGRIWALDETVFGLTAVLSRKTHATAGPFDLPIALGVPVTGAVTVEPRGIGAGHLIVFQFNNSVNAVGSVSVANAFGAPLGSSSLATSGNELRVTLTDVPDITRATISFTGVNSGFAASVSLGFLVGDVNNSRSVNASDISGIRAKSGQVLAIGLQTFKFDVNLSGNINAADLSAVKARSGVTLP